jgi:hypothetical protein
MRQLEYEVRDVRGIGHGEDSAITEGRNRDKCNPAYGTGTFVVLTRVPGASITLLIPLVPYTSDRLALEAEIELYGA